MSRKLELIPVIVADNHNFFDDLIEELHHQAMRKNYDMRNAMARLEPREPIARMNTSLEEQMKKLRHPMVTRPDGSQALELQLDLSNYKPEEISIKTNGQELSVFAEHEEKTENSSVSQKYCRKLILPDDVNPESVKSSLTKDGILCVTAPVVKESEKPIKIPIRLSMSN